MFRPSLRLRALVLGAVTAVSLSVGGGTGLAHPPQGDAIITNGVVQLGIHPQAHLNVPGGPPSSGEGTTDVGLRYVPTGAEATAPGCLCEGWGVADAGTGVTGYANEAVDGVVNITVQSFVFTPTTAVSTVHIGSTFEVTHDYHPSASPNLYESVVTIKNISGSAVSDVRYRRVMDWDVEPTAFSEFVTAQGTTTATALLDNNNDGFATANPLGPDTSGVLDCPVVTGDFTDNGPCDHGARFDFGFGGLASGASMTFKIFYGADATEAGAIAALTAVGAEVYSLGQCDNAGDASCSQTTGTPNTFIFAFAGVGGPPIGRPPLDHFKCYRLPDGDDDDDDGVARRRVTLEDQFGRGDAFVGRALELCNPVSKEGSTVKQPNAHLVKYGIEPIGRTFSTRRVQVKNQFGDEQILDVREPAILAVPSSKSLTGDPGAPPATLDHFQCYPLAGDDDDDDNGGSAFTQRNVNLVDQFKSETVRVLGPVALCNPAEKTHDGVVTPIGSEDEHLVCYAIRAAKFSGTVNVRNQFGDATLRVRRPVTLCVPSEKTELPPPPPGDDDDG